MFAKFSLKKFKFVFGGGSKSLRLQSVIRALPGLFYSSGSR